MHRDKCPPPLPARGVKVGTVTLPNSFNSNERVEQHLDNRNSLSSSLYTIIHDDVESTKSTDCNELEKAPRPSLPTPPPSQTRHASKLARVSDPRLWVLMQATLVAAFAIGCAILNMTRSKQLEIARMENDRAWMKLVFDIEQLSNCRVGLDNGCLNGLIYITTGERFGPLIENGIKAPLRPGHTTLAEFGQLKQDGLKTKLVIKQAAMYRVYARVTFRDSTSDMPVETSVQMNDSIWIHCEQSHQTGVRVTICILYGTRRLQVNDWLAFICTDKFREISAASNETFFFIERLRRLK